MINYNMTDKKKSKPSKEDIAKQFDLPERQSKITSLLNQAGQAYCICRSSDSSRFMIACDSCEEWYHGDCINISEREARYIKTYFCDKCREEDPTLKPRFKLQKREHEPNDASALPEEQKKKKKEHNENRPAKRSQSSRRRSKERYGCGDCSGCTTTVNCGICDQCYDLDKQDYPSKTKIRCEQRVCRKLLGKSSGSRSRKQATNTSPETLEVSVSHLQTAEARQCYGPQCLQPALYGSKYCSSKCGMLLATARIYQVLPQRIQEWSLSPCIAESKDRKALERVRSEFNRVQATLSMYDKQHAELDLLVNRVKNCNLLPKLSDDKEHEDESLIHCITCGHEVHSRTAIKHMEKCFVKHEAQASFGSRHRTRIDGTSMFCDYYNTLNGTYCKRLRVLCPEHSKDPKINDTDLCGCPLVRDIFVPNGDFCKAPKKSCIKHYMWEKLRRAEIDMERVRQWMRVDELMEQEKQIRAAMASRAGVLGLMLHSTYNHEVMERITGQSTNPDLHKDK